MAPMRRRVKRDLLFAIKELVGCKWKDGKFYEATVVDIRRSQYIKSFLHHSLVKSFKDRIKIRYIEDGIVETLSVDKFTSIQAEHPHCPIAVKTNCFTASPRVVIASLHAFGSGLPQINRDDAQEVIAPVYSKKCKTRKSPCLAKKRWARKHGNLRVLR
ncbi:hypothetical protein CAPTEDRAFT_214551 [Capitella teleta]|uniref:Uncharacterized protein n=1 Tax=Capitella teleta TaxID=283909 RepID=R7TPD1_CAPTE|nr:hypothetical protein CAPTEDRAFT_214551 [Capitella teleta]|eukprot:ELT95748.1 hypothetical protein CAPTEDRAFT_214551 [Capitella teleta]